MDAPTPRQRRTRTRHAAEVRDRPPVKGRSEVIEEADRVVVAFHLPEVPLHDLSHRLTGQLLLVWSARNGVPYQCMMPLPAWADTRSYYARSNNGLIEFVFGRSR